MTETQYIWLLTQVSKNGYDTYDSCVVVAATDYTARRIHPDGDRARPETWARPEQVTVAKVGIAIGRKSGDVICSSFNAG